MTRNLDQELYAAPRGAEWSSGKLGRRRRPVAALAIEPEGDGMPQLGHEAASVETSWPHSRHLASAIDYHA